jgi:hypothetical protein
VGKHIVTSHAMIAALEKAGIVPNRTRRVVLDLQYGEAPIVHIEQFGDEDLLDVFRALDGVEVTRLASPTPVTADAEAVTAAQSARPGPIGCHPPVDRHDDEQD